MCLWHRIESHSRWVNYLFSGGIGMQRPDTKTSDAQKLLAFAVLFFGKKRVREAEEVVENVLRSGLEANAGLPIPAGTERTLMLLNNAHRRLEKGYLLRAKRMSRAASREVATDLTGLLALPGAQRETVILTKCIGFSYHEAAKITGRPIGTVRSRVNRACHVLAEKFGLMVVV